MPHTSRRRFIAQGASLTGLLAWGTPHAAPATAATDTHTDARFVFIIQRGAADGLHTLVPYGDPAYARLRGELALPVEQATRLDGLFALHPALGQVAAMYAQGDALLVHAVASPYRERSHFDGQNVLETGGNQPYQMRDGWLNRLVSLLPQRPRAIALAPTVPVALRGDSKVLSYAPSNLRAPSDDLLLRVQQLYRSDTQLDALWTTALQTRGMASSEVTRQDPASLGTLAASFLVRDDGPRIAMLETEGWDTHSGQAGRMANQLKGLDALLGALRTGLGDTWARTTVLVATEFGRTAAANGTGGTDHGTGAVALLLGGRVQGGRVLADWPGLDTPALLDGRDLRPTLGLDALIARAAAESFGLDPERLGRQLFARGAVAQPLREPLLRG